MTSDYEIKWYDRYEDIPPGIVIERRDDNVVFKEVHRRGIFIYHIGRSGTGPNARYHEQGPFWHFEYLQEILPGKKIVEIRKVVKDHSRHIEIVLDDQSVIAIWDSEQYEVPFGMSVNGVEVV